MSEQDDLTNQELDALDKLMKRQREDRGGESNAIQDSAQARGSFLITSMRSINDNKDYRQELKTGNYSSVMKQGQMVLAIDEMRECGIDETLVIDLLIAQKAGEKGGFMAALLNALTHSSYTANFTGKGKNWWQSAPKEDRPQQ